jgi:hypothetical protein
MNRNHGMRFESSDIAIRGNQRVRQAESDMNRNHGMRFESSDIAIRGNQRVRQAESDMNRNHGMRFESSDIESAVRPRSTMMKTSTQSVAAAVSI